MRSKIIHQLPKQVRADLFDLGLIIREGRTAKGLTQGALAARLQISPTTVRAAEQGDPAVTAGILVALLWSLGVGPITNVAAPQRAQWAKKTTSRKRVHPKATDDF